MSDLIRREDAIRAVAEVLSLNRFASFKNIKDFGRFAERMLRNVPSADRPQEWIPCSERLPNESDYYLVTLRGEFNEIEPCVVWFAHEDDYDCDSEWREITDSDTVLAWMPLPKPWEGADDE